MRKKSSLFAVVVCFALLLFVGQPAALAAKKHILAHGMESSHNVHKFSVKFIEYLGELSGGKMQIAFHPGGDLGDWLVIMEQSMQGVIAMSLGWGMAEVDPRVDINIIPFLARDWNEARKVFKDYKPLQDLYQDIFAGYGLTCIALVPCGFTGSIFRNGVKVPTNFPEDAAGIKIRVPNIPAQIVRHKAMGYSPVSMPFSEVHTAFQTKAIDARAGGPAIEALPFQDVISAYLSTREHVDHAFFSANKKWFDGLSAEERGWVTAAAKKAEGELWDAMEVDEKEIFKRLEKAGINVVVLPEAAQLKMEKLVIDAEYPLYRKLCGNEFIDNLLAYVAAMRQKK